MTPPKSTLPTTPAVPPPLMRVPTVTCSPLYPGNSKLATNGSLVGQPAPIEVRTAAPGGSDWNATSSSDPRVIVAQPPSARAASPIMPLFMRVVPQPSGIQHTTKARVESFYDLGGRRGDAVAVPPGCS